MPDCFFALYARFRSTLRPTAGSATTTFLPTAAVPLKAFAFFLSAVFAAEAARAMPVFFFSAGPGLVTLGAFNAAAGRPARLGFMTVVPLEAVEMSVELLCVLAWLNAR